MQREVFVVNASPLIALAKIGQLVLLARPGREVVIPDAVAREVLAGSAHDPAHAALVSGFGAPYPEAPADVRVAAWGLGAGECAVLSLALARGGTAVVDDRDARVAARTLGVGAVGTLGVVMQARRDGRIASAASVVHDLLNAGLRLSDRIIAAALREAFGEVWP